jgi:hypothetical protein
VYAAWQAIRCSGLTQQQRTCCCHKDA